MATHSTAIFSTNDNRGFQLGFNNGTIENINIGVKPDDNCLKELRLSDPRDDKERIKDTKGDLLKGSYKWILDHPDYLRWRDDDQSRLLWIKGDDEPIWIPSDVESDAEDDGDDGQDFDTYPGRSVESLQVHYSTKLKRRKRC